MQFFQTMVQLYEYQRTFPVGLECEQKRFTVFSSIDIKLLLIHIHKYNKSHKGNYFDVIF